MQGGLAGACNSAGNYGHSSGVGLGFSFRTLMMISCVEATEGQK